MAQDLALLTRDLDYDHGSIESDRTRLSATTARAAVAEYVATGEGACLRHMGAVARS
jgi:hypothetical protein